MIYPDKRSRGSGVKRLSGFQPALTNDCEPRSVSVSDEGVLGHHRYCRGARKAAAPVPGPNRDTNSIAFQASVGQTVEFVLTCPRCLGVSEVPDARVRQVDWAPVGASSCRRRWRVTRIDSRSQADGSLAVETLPRTSKSAALGARKLDRAVHIESVCAEHAARNDEAVRE